MSLEASTPMANVTFIGAEPSRPGATPRARRRILGEAPALDHRLSHFLQRPGHWPVGFHGWAHKTPGGTQKGKDGYVRPVPAQ